MSDQKPPEAGQEGLHLQIQIARNLIGALPMPTILFGPDERAVVANRAAEDMFGAAIEGRLSSAILRQPVFADGLETCLKTGGSSDARLTQASKGRETHLRVHIAPIRFDQEGWALVSFEDLTALEQTSAMRRDFVANVSHELRTPLTALVGFIDTLSGAARNDSAARDRFLGIMEREAGRMIRLVNDLLSLSRVEAEERSRPSQPVEITSLLRGAIATHQKAADAAQVKLVFVAPDQPLLIPADSDQLSQVFHNLIENALKYGSGGGEVTVKISEIDFEPVLQGPGLQVEVIDRGEGIDALHLPRLTERFYRVDAHRSREKGGTGLGLAIVKHIVNRHRGRLRIESQAGKGSRFIVILPQSATRGPSKP